MIDDNENKFIDLSSDDKINIKKFVQNKKRIVFEKIDIIDLVIVISCGVGLVVSILYDAKEVASSIGGGLVGYLSKSNKSQ